jgi:hypothetical protein
MEQLMLHLTGNNVPLVGVDVAEEDKMAEQNGSLGAETA